jgi:TatD DNase family protein
MHQRRGGEQVSLTAGGEVAGRRGAAAPGAPREDAAGGSAPGAPREEAAAGSAPGAPREDAAGGSAPPPLPQPLAVPALDSHCHLDLMRVPVPEALAQARAVGVNQVVQIGIDVPSSRWSAQAAAEHDGLLAAVAVHPNEAPRLAAAGALAGEIEQIDELAALPRVRAVGETGLDYFRTGPDGTAAQHESFRRHIEIAKRHGVALVIHDRDAHGDVLQLLEEEGPPDRVVFHCFSGDADMAKVCANRGYVMSFAGNITFKNAQPLRDAAAAAPLDLILVETDAPFLTPMPYRGRPNAPYLVPLTLRRIAEVKSVDLDDLCAAVSATGQRIFGPG